MRPCFPVMTWILLLVFQFTACAPTKTIDVWKTDGYDSRLRKVMVVAVTPDQVIRQQFENVLANRLSDLGVEVVMSHKVVPGSIRESNKDEVIAAVHRTGVENVLVARSIARKEIVNHQLGGMFFAPTALYSDGWYTYWAGTVVIPEREYDTTYFTVATNLFDVDSKKPVWSYLAQVRVEGARQGAVNRFVPLIVTELKESRLL